MAFWSHQINQKTGRPFESQQEFDQRVQDVSGRHGAVIDFFQQELEGLYPKLDRTKTRAALARYIAAYGDPPSDPNQLKGWTRNFTRSINRMRIDEQRGWLEDAGLDPDKDWNTPDAQRVMMDNSTKIWGGPEGDAFSSFGDAEAHSELDPGTTSMGLQGIEDTTGAVTGTGPDATESPDARLKAYYDAIYSRQDESRIAASAGNQARRENRGAGLQGGLSQLGTAQAVANAQLGYKQNTNAQALQYLGMDQGVQMQQDALAAQAAQFNASQRAAAAQQAYAARGQLGGTIGGIAGGVVGGVIQAYTGAPVAGAFTAAGTGLGSMAGAGAGAGAVPGAASYSTRGMGSLAKKGGSSSGGSSSNY